MKTDTLWCVMLSLRSLSQIKGTGAAEILSRNLEPAVPYTELSLLRSHASSKVRAEDHGCQSKDSH